MNVEPTGVGDARRVVLVTRSGYDETNPEHHGLLVRLHARRIGLFCAVGRDCEVWHDRMDDVCVGAMVDAGDEWHVQTTWHDDESVAEVIEFAREWSFANYDSGIVDDTAAVEVIEV